MRQSKLFTFIVDVTYVAWRHLKARMILFMLIPVFPPERIKGPQPQEDSKSLMYLINRW